ncbi:MAG: hypothetical protein II975_02485 [Bacteroidales bacterium]|nr:hypothetical protein [Bacteroidales bacterium]
MYREGTFLIADEPQIKKLSTNLIAPMKNFIPRQEAIKNQSKKQAVNQVA